MYACRLPTTLLPAVRLVAGAQPKHPSIHARLPVVWAPCVPTQYASPRCLAIELPIGVVRSFTICTACLPACVSQARSTPTIDQQVHYQATP